MTLGGPYFEAQLVAVLPVHDLDRAELWYGRIGFEVSASYPDYRVLRAGHLILHLRLLDLGEGPSTAGVYLTMPSEDAVAIVHAAWTAAGPGVLTEPMLHPHGLVEFAAEDPDGNLWRIGAPAGTTPAPERAVDSGLAPDRAPGREPIAEALARRGLPAANLEALATQARTLAAQGRNVRQSMEATEREAAAVEAQRARWNSVRRLVRLAAAKDEKLAVLLAAC